MTSRMMGNASSSTALESGYRGVYRGRRQHILLAVVRTASLGASTLLDLNIIMVVDQNYDE